MVIPSPWATVIATLVDIITNPPKYHAGPIRAASSLRCLLLDLRQQVPPASSVVGLLDNASVTCRWAAARLPLSINATA